jgi:hypothetical protein
MAVKSSGAGVSRCSSGEMHCSRREAPVPAADAVGVATWLRRFSPISAFSKKDDVGESYERRVHDVVLLCGVRSGSCAHPF